VKLEVTHDAAEFDGRLERLGVDDIYFTLAYAQLWAREHNTEAIGIYGHDESGCVVYPLLRESLDALPGGSGRCDVRTAYDFGGPLAVGDQPSRTLKAFGTAFDRLARDWGVVTEFVRLHPLRHPAIPDHATLHAHNYIVDLTRGIEALRTDRPASFRRGLRRGEREGVRARIVTDCDGAALARFLELYVHTMQRVDADRDYYFSERILGALLARPETFLAEAWRGGKILASACFLRSGFDLFYFLGGSRSDALQWRPNHALFDAAIQHAGACGLERLHLGGGAPGLQRFKSQMATGQVPYSLIRRVHDPDAYARLCAACETDPASKRFPAYRR
jgi:hypothetical protein